MLFGACAQPKRPTVQNGPRYKTSQGHKVPRLKVPGTKRPMGQNVLWDKTSYGTKRPREKTSQGTKHPTLLYIITKFLITHFMLENSKLAPYVRLHRYGPYPCTQFMIGLFLLWGD